MANDTASGADPTMLANGAFSAIQARADFLALLRALVQELREKPETWENNTLPLFLEATAAWTEDMDGYYQNQGRAVPDQPTWQVLAEMFLAARVYE
jgi:hypothetical protein